MACRQTTVRPSRSSIYATPCPTKTSPACFPLTRRGDGDAPNNPAGGPIHQGRQDNQGGLGIIHVGGSACFGHGVAAAAFRRRAANPSRSVVPGCASISAPPFALPGTERGA